MSIAQALTDSGYTPRQADLDAVVAVLVDGDESQATAAQQALLRAEGLAGTRLVVALASAGATARVRILRCLGRLARQSPGLQAALVASLADPTPAVRRAAIVALGKLGVPSVAAPLLNLAAAGTSDGPELRALVEALGKLGEPAALPWLEALDPGGDPELARLRVRAQLMLSRSVGRSEDPGALVLTAPADEHRRVQWTCRIGLEHVVAEMLGPSWHAKVLGPGRVHGRMTGSLAAALAVRTALGFGFPLAPVRVSADVKAGTDALVQVIVDTLTSRDAQTVLTTWTRGPVRYRLAWAQGGHQRATVWRVAQAVAQVCPRLVNDPTDSLWEVFVDVGADRVALELRPRGVDTRFAYRLGDVPAASHPTIAAALAWLGGVLPGDVVWDPFVGSGTELVERGLLGPHRELCGSDSDPNAVAIAGRNLEAAGVLAALTVADACTHHPRGITQIVTNPPMGRRVHRGDVAPLLTTFVTHAATVLQPGGRLTWVTPLPRVTGEAARRVGLVCERSHLVDMGGFSAQLERWRRPI